MLRGLLFCDKRQICLLIRHFFGCRLKTITDLSRLGRERNYMGIFMEYIFPKFGVRFISIGESVDSSKGDNDMVPLINLFNEWHVKSTSQKVRAVKDMKARQGKRSGGFAPYGYIF